MVLERLWEMNWMDCQHVLLAFSRHVDFQHAEQDGTRWTKSAKGVGF
jgi:hypothetical protein